MSAMSENMDALLVSEGRIAASSGEGRAVREAAGLSMGELARMLGVDASQVSRWERGERSMRAGTAQVYALGLRALREQVGDDARRVKDA